MKYLLPLLLTITVSIPGGAAAWADEDNIVSGKYRVITQEEEERTRDRLPGSGTTRGGRTYLTFTVPETGLEEKIEYLLPPGYDPQGAPYPMIVCWHGYGQSHASVSIDSMIDEECQEREWIFLSILGHIQTNFGYPIAQIHCTAAIEHVIDALGLNVDTGRIYMAGFSMGGGAAASYASRHMAEGEGYPIAGLILVASVVDWTYAYNQGDPAAQYWLPKLLGGNPGQVPFAYKQISALFIENGAYMVDESMGQNLRHHLPVFIAYAEDDALSNVLYLNDTFVNMLAGLSANVLVDYYPSGTTPYPHHWLLLDVDAAFDFIEPCSLADQQTDTVTLLADRDARFYWAGVGQTLRDAFSKVAGEADDSQNRLVIQEASNLNLLEIDCGWTGLGDQEPLGIEYHSSEAYEQHLKLKPVDTQPTYIVNTGGVLHPNYSYSPTSNMVNITRAPSEDLDLKVSFEIYALTLSADGEVKTGKTYTIQMGNGAPFDPFLLFFAFTQKETKVGIHHLLVHPFTPTIWFMDHLDGLGSYTLPILVPKDPALVGVTVHHQFLTYDTAIKEISNLSATQIK